MKSFLLVFLGGGLGSLLRYAISLLPISTSSLFPYKTFFINCIGSFFIGVLMYYFQALQSNTWKLLLATGFCGGFTTFSAFSFETLQLFQQQQYLIAILYILLSILLGIGCCVLGYFLFSF
ncbi:MAG: fluoride efflux transporter CrcB [Chitinophagaceae bacterium]